MMLGNWWCNCLRTWHIRMSKRDLCKRNTLSLINSITNRKSLQKEHPISGIEKLDRSSIWISKFKNLRAPVKYLWRCRGEEFDPGPYRTEFDRDRDRILYSKAFRRLKGKTQIFLSSGADYLRTRLPILWKYHRFRESSPTA